MADPQFNISGFGIGGLTVAIPGFDEALNLVDELTPKLVQAAIVAVRNENEHLFQITQDQVPIGPTGQLRASGNVTEVEVISGELTAGIKYGGPAGSGRGPTMTVRVGGEGRHGKGGHYETKAVSQQTGDVDYAVIVHEDMEAHHPNGKAKYVEDPVRGAMEGGTSLKRMQRDMESALHLKRGSLHI